MVFSFNALAECQPYEQAGTTEGSCVHRCSGIGLRWSGSACVECPNNQYRNATNECVVGTTCPEGSTEVGMDFGIDHIGNADDNRSVCRRNSDGVRFRISWTGQLRSIYDDTVIESIPAACENSPNGEFQRDGTGQCRHICASDAGPTVASYLTLNASGNCESCPSNKVLAANSNNCECPPNTSWVDARNRCESAETTAVFQRAATNCVEGAGRNESECRAACLQVRGFYRENPSLFAETLQCGNYIPEVSMTSHAIPSGFHWQGTPTILQVGIGREVCGMNHDICYGPIEGSLPNPDPSSTDVPPPTVLMAKCFIPKNSTQCPTELTEDRNCTLENMLVDRVDNPGLPNCTAEYQRECICADRVVSQGSRCTLDARNRNINSKCSGSFRNTTECVRACIEVNYVHPRCPNRTESLEILTSGL